MKNNMFKKMLILSVFALSVLLSKQMFAPFIAVGLHNDTTKIYENIGDDWKVVKEIKGEIFQSSFIPDGKHFIVVENLIKDGKVQSLIKILNTENFETINTIELDGIVHEGHLSKSFDLSENYLILKADKKIKIFGAKQNWGNIKTISMKNAYPSFKIYKKYLVVRDGKEVTIFDIDKNWEKMKTIRAQKNEGDFRISEKYFVLVDGKEIKIFDIDKNWQKMKTIEIKYTLYYHSFQLSEKYLVARDGKEIKIFNIDKNWNIVKTMILDKELFSSFQMSEKYFVLVDGQKIKIFDMDEDWREVKIIKVQDKFFLTDLYETYFVWTEDQEIKIFDADKPGKKVKIIKTDSWMTKIKIFDSPQQAPFQEFTAGELEERQELLERMESW